MTDLPMWAHVETDAQEATRLAAIYQREGSAVARYAAWETVHAIKHELGREAQFAEKSGQSRWSPKRLFYRWRLSRVARSLIKKHTLRRG